MAASVLAWAAWREGFAVRAVAWAVFALFVKMTGIAICVCICLAIVLRMISGHRTRREWLLLPVLPIAVFIVMRLGDWLGAVPVTGPGWGNADTLIRSLVIRLDRIPDVSLLIAVGIVASLAVIVLRLRTETKIGWRACLEDLVGGDSRTSGMLVGLLMPVVFCGMILATVFFKVLFLPRYLLPVLPFVLGAIALLSVHIKRERVLTGLVSAFAVFGVVNWNGLLYAPEYVSFSILERTHAYQDYHAVQRALIDAIADAPSELPLFVSREIDYMVSDPMMGYIKTKPARVESLYHWHWVKRGLDEYPGDFLLAYSNPGHGGEVAMRLLNDASAREGVQIRSRVFERNGYKTALYRIMRAPQGNGPG